MGAPNFARPNASHYFAVLMGYYQPIVDDEGNETEEQEYVYPEHWEWEENIDFLQTKMCELVEQKKYRGRYTVDELDSSDNARCYTGQYFSQVSIYREFGDIEVGVIVKCIRRSAYHEGANLDWELEYDYLGDTSDTLAYLTPDEAEHYSDMPYGMIVIQSRNASNWLAKTGLQLTQLVEEKFAEACGVELRCTAQFSNGEAHYERVEG